MIEHNNYSRYSTIAQLPAALSSLKTNELQRYQTDITLAQSEAEEQ